LPIDFYQTAFKEICVEDKKTDKNPPRFSGLIIIGVLQLIFPESLLNNQILAGLLTYSIFERPSRSLLTSGLSIVQRLWQSLQQRVCPGFAPGSLFITFL